MASEKDLRDLIDKINDLKKQAGRSDFLKFDTSNFSDAAKYAKELSEDIEDLQNRLKGMSSDWDYITKRIKESVENSKGFGRNLETARVAYSKISKIAEELQDHATQAATLSATDLKLKRAQLLEQRKLLETQLQLVDAEDARKKDLEQELKLVDEMVDRSTDLIKEQSSIRKIYQDQSKELQGQVQNFIQNKIQAISLGSVLKTLYNQMTLFSDQSFKSQKAFGISADAAHAMTQTIKNASLGMKNIDFEEAVDANIQLNEQFATSTVFSKQMVEDQARFQKLMGLSTEEASKLSEYTVLTGKTQEDIAKQIGKSGDKSLNQKKILQEVLKVEGQLAAQYKNDPVQLAKAVEQTTKLGMTLQQAANASRGLLNFEDSIASELEAELLTGKNLNLEKARYLALQGDSAGAAKELMREVGSLTEFQNMNVLQQDAIAKAMGMSTDELANSLKKQEALTKLQRDSPKAFQEVNALRKAGRDEEADALQASLTANKNNLDIAKQELSAKDSIATLQKKIALSFGKFLDSGAVKGLRMVLSGVLDVMTQPWLQGILGVAGGIAGVVAAIGSVMAIGRGLKALLFGKPGSSASNPLFAKLVGKGGSASLDIAGAGKNLFKKGGWKGLLGGAASMALGGDLMGGGEEEGGGGGGGGASAPSSPGPLTKAGKPDMRFKANRMAASTSSAADVAGDVAKSGGGGFFGKVGGFFSGITKKAGNLLGKLNPMTYLKKLFTDKGSLKKILGKIPKIGSIINLAMTAYDLYSKGASAADMKAQGASYQDIGKSVLMSVGDLGGTLLGGIAGTFLSPGIGNMIGGTLGGMAGSKLAGFLADNIDVSGLGKGVVDIFGSGGGQPKKMAAGGIVTKATNIVAGEAGAEAIIPLTGARGPSLLNKVAQVGGGGGAELVAEMRAVKAVLQQILHKEGDITLDGVKVGTALNIATRKLQ